MGKLCSKLQSRPGGASLVPTASGHWDKKQRQKSDNSQHQNGDSLSQNQARVR